MATQAYISWNPSSTNSTEQKVQYRVKGTENWITFSTLGALANQETITGLQANLIYEFRILNNCTSGGAAPSPTQTKVNLECPLNSITSSAENVNYSFPHQGGDISKYQVDLLSANNSTVLQTKNHTSPFAATITGSFVGLNPQTNYYVRVTMFAGTSYEHNKTCGSVPANTTAPETCSPPTNVNVVISSGSNE